MQVLVRITADINVSDINGTVPNEATLALLSNDDKFIQKFYRWHEFKYNDGSQKTVLQYWGEQGGWHTSEYMVKPQGLLKMKFLKIIR